MIRKFILMVCMGLFLVGQMNAQQESNFTLYMLNPIVYNPALAGTANFYQIRTDHRFQWAGLNDAPVTNSISAFGPHSKKDMGFGGTVYNDITGPTSRSGANAFYGYNISVQKDLRVSFGLSLGILQYKIDLSKLKDLDQTKIPNSPSADPLLLQGSAITSFTPDASAGVYVWQGQFYGGFSGLHLLDVFSKDAKDNITGINILKTHYYLIGGYLHQINREWFVEPCMVVKKVVPASFQLEVSCKAIYKNMLWGGLALRTQDAFSVVLGYVHDKKIHIGYAFDLGINDIRRYTAGSHEIVIGYNFAKIKKSLGKKKK